MPNDTVYDEEYCISGDVTFTASRATVAATPSPFTPDEGPDFNLTANYDYRASGSTVFVLNESATNSYYAGSRFVRNTRAAHPFEAILTTGVVSSSAPAYFLVGGSSSAKTRATRTPDGKPHIDDL